jgi:hypothetical protein
VTVMAAAMPMVRARRARMFGAGGFRRIVQREVFADANVQFAHPNLLRSPIFDVRAARAAFNHHIIKKSSFRFFVKVTGLKEEVM